ncbi:uncharacterized protein MONBRDRAFT_34058 [Monosiga brevicollis MX1]|uniref:Methionine synthase reductase n=1 Tax=Monosiga brevicollis TaxID=81824 RepID=A9V987_MONBE|nr:uncharacterized protein MONBRDRAFT_34058 [Monosiga brevicollis MX1]EDQ85818.1 predicted protein [Monosiga brevicollis MX1]|eukprot:XP_001749297.1 hypothetical protein [Monosiga brevicollis MX1]
MALPPHDFLILYGSQTGQAEGIAGDLQKDLSAAGLNPLLFCMDQFKKFDLTQERLVVIVCSTTGEGDAPDNANRLWRQTKKKTLPSNHFAQLSYTVLGLGDTNYANFCQMGKNWYKRNRVDTCLPVEHLNHTNPASLKDLGATCFYPPGFADDGTGLEIVVEPWRAGLLDALRKRLAELPPAAPAASASEAADPGASSTAAIAAKSAVPVGNAILRLPRLHKLTFDVQLQAPETVDPETEMPTPTTTPYRPAVLTRYRVLTAPSAVKRAIEVELAIGTGTAGHYSPGDAFAVACPNRPSEIDLFLSVSGHAETADHPLSFSGAVPAHLENCRTLREVATSALELRGVPKKAHLRLLAEYCLEAADRSHFLWLSSQQGGNDYTANVRNSTGGLLEILVKCPSCRPPLHVLFTCFAPLQPRFYSACSAARASPGYVRFAFNVVDDISSPDGQAPEDGTTARPGLCTTYFEELCLSLHDVRPADVADMRAKETRGQWVGPATAIKVEDVCTPTALPTDGRLPVRVLCEEHWHDHGQPIIMVGPGTGIAPFIGFLEAREELEQAVRDKALEKWVTAVSRETTSSGFKYVQDALRANATLVSKLLLEEEGSLFVCGSAINMGRRLDEQLETIFMTGAGLSSEDAAIARARLVTEARIKKDLW